MLPNESVRRRGADAPTGTNQEGWHHITIRETLDVLAPGMASASLLRIFDSRTGHIKDADFTDAIVLLRLECSDVLPHRCPN